MPGLSFVLTMGFGMKMPLAGSYDTDAAFYYTRDQSFNESEPSFGTIKQNNVSKSSSVAKIKVVVCLCVISNCRQLVITNYSAHAINNAETSSVLQVCS